MKSESFAIDAKYQVWIEYFTKQLPISESNIKKMSKGSKNPLFAFLRSAPTSPQSALHVKNMLQSCKTQENIGLYLGNIFGLKIQVELEQLEQLRFSCSYTPKQSEGNLREFLDISNMRTLILISFDFKEEFTNIFIKKKISSRIPSAILNYIPFFFDYFSGKSDRTFNNFLVVVDPIMMVLKDNFEVLYNDNKIFLESLIGILVKILIKIPPNKNQFAQIFSYFYYFSIFLIQQKQLLGIEKISDFLDFTKKKYACIGLKERKKLFYVCVKIVDPIRPDFIVNKTMAFKIYSNCITIMLNSSSENDLTVITSTLKFIYWTIQTFNISLIYPEKRISIDKIERNNNKKFLSLKLDDVLKRKIPVPQSDELTMLKAFEEFRFIKDHLGVIVEKINASLPNKTVGIQVILELLENTLPINAKLVLNEFFVTILSKISFIDCLYDILIDKFSFIFEPQVFDILTDHINNKFTLMFQTQYINVIFSYLYELFTTNDTCRNLILNTIKAHYCKLEDQKLDDNIFCFTKNILKFFNIFVSNNQEETYYIFSIIEILFKQLQIWWNTNLGNDLYDFIQSLFLLNPETYFKSSLCLEKIYMLLSEEAFTDSAYELLLYGISSLVKVNDKKSISIILIYLSKYYKDILLKENMDSVIFERIDLFGYYIKERIEFPDELIETILMIPIKIKTKESFIKAVDFLYFQSNYMISNNLDKFSEACKKISVNCIDFDKLTTIALGKEAKFGDNGEIINPSILNIMYRFLAKTPKVKIFISYIEKLISFSNYNCSACASSGLIQEMLENDIKTTNLEITQVLNYILENNATPSIIKFILLNLQNSFSRNKLNCVFDYLISLTNKKSDDPKFYIKLKEPIFGQQINQNVFSEGSSYETTFLICNLEKCTLLQLYGNSFTSLSIYIEEQKINVHIEQSKKVTHIIFDEIFQQNVFHHIKITFFKNSISLNGKEEKSYQFNQFYMQLKINIGDKDLSISDSYFYNSQGQIICGISMDKLKNGMLVFKYIDKDDTTVEFSGYPVIYHQNAIYAFSDFDVLESLFNLIIIYDINFRDKVFKFIISILENQFVQNCFINCNGGKLIESIINKSSLLTKSHIDFIYSIMKDKSEEFIYSIFENIWLNPSIFIKSDYSVILYYVQTILIKLLESYLVLLSKMFNRTCFHNYLTFLSSFDQNQINELSGDIWNFIFVILTNQNKISSNLYLLEAFNKKEYIKLMDIKKNILTFITQNIYDNNDIIEFDKNSFHELLMLICSNDKDIQFLSFECAINFAENHHEKSKLFNYIFNFIQTTKLNYEVLQKLTLQCLEIFAKDHYSELLPILAYFSSEIKIKKIINEIVNELKANLRDNFNSIEKISFWINWILIIYQNCYKDEKSLINELETIILLLHINDENKIFNLFNDLNIISVASNTDFTKLKKSALTLYLNNLFSEGNVIEEDKCLKIFKLLFSMFFKNTLNGKSMLMEKQIFNIDTFSQIEYKKSYFYINPESNLLSDINFESKFFDISVKYIYSNILIHFDKNISIKVPLIIGYIIGILIKTGKFTREDFLENILENIDKMDCDVEHTFCGILLNSYNIKDSKQCIQTENKIIQKLLDTFNLIDDPNDSPSLQAFLFEDYINSNCPSFNFFSN